MGPFSFKPPQSLYVLPIPWPPSCKPEATPMFSKYHSSRIDLVSRSPDLSPCLDTTFASAISHLLKDSVCDACLFSFILGFYGMYLTSNLEMITDLKERCASPLVPIALFRIMVLCQNRELSLGQRAPRVLSSQV